MTTDRIRTKRISAARMLHTIEVMEKKGTYDTDTLEALAKTISKTAFIGDTPPGTNVLDGMKVNEPFEVAELLRDLNHLINTISKLWDKDYYLDYIFNAGAAIKDGLEELEITEDWLSGLIDKFEKLRSLLYGDCIDWDEVEIAMMRNAAYSLREDNCRLENRNRELESKRKNNA